MQQLMRVESKAALTVIVLILISWSPLLRAQENATITGTITEASGAAVPNAAITATRVETGEKRSTTSNSTGTYIFTALGVGHYSLSASAPGFEGFVQQGIALNFNDTIRIDVHLKIGSVGQSVTVTANALQLQEETNEVSDLISGQQVTQLETNGRNVIALAALGMGVAGNLPDFNSITGPSSTVTISFEGTRSEHNVWMIDNAEVYDRGAGGDIDIMPSPDALAQFQTLDSNYSPQYGIASGGTIAMVLKSGTRDLHGGLWEFNRNDIFDANNYISNMSGLPKPELRLNIYGGNLGGPIWIPHVYDSGRKKAFFFVSEEWRREVAGSNPSLHQALAASNFPVAGQPLTYTIPANGPTPVVPAIGDANELALYTEDGLTQGQPFPHNTIPANLIDQNAVLFMGTGAFPRPDAANNEYIVRPVYQTNVREDIVRVDDSFNDKFQLMAHYIHDAMVGQSAGTGDNTFGNLIANRFVPAYAGTIKLTQIYTPSLLNETAFNYNRDAIHWTYAPGTISQEPPGFSIGSLFPSNNTLHLLPEVVLGAPYSFTYDAGWLIPYHNGGNNYEATDNASWTKGKHQITFGGGYLRYTKAQVFQTEQQGQYSFSTGFSGDSYVNFLLGLSSTYTQLESQNDFHTVSNTPYFYGNDNWHVTSRLTLNLGLRYDGLPHTWERNNRFANFVPANYNPADAPEFNAGGSMNPSGPGFSTPAGSTTPFYLNGIELGGVNGVPRGMVKNHWNTLEPRVGFAAEPFGGGKTVLRGGFGTFFERIEGQDSFNLATNPPFAYLPSLSNVFFSNPAVSTTNGATATAAAVPVSITSLAKNYPVPETAEYSLGVQRQISPAVIAVVQYVGNSAWHQSDDRNINTLPLNSPEREAVSQGTYNTNLARTYPGFAGISQQETATNSNYNSLQAGLRTENWHRLTVQLAYTYSHEIDAVSEDLTAVDNPFNIKYNRASGTYDRRHIFNANYIYNSPFFAHSGNAFARQALGGWEFSGITFAESGQPNEPTYSPDVLGLGGGATNRPNLVAGTAGPKTQKEYFNKAAFTAPVAPWNGGPNQGFGDAGRDAIVGPGRLNFNLALFKSFPLTSHEGPQFEFRLESFNTFNHTQFMSLSTSYTASTFGEVTAVQDPRVLQLSGKFLF